MKDYSDTIKHLRELRTHINNCITDAQTVCETHDDYNQVNQSLYVLAGAARDIIMLCGYHTV